MSKIDFYFLFQMSAPASQNIDNRSKRARIMVDNINNVFVEVIKKVPKLIEESIDCTDTFIPSDLNGFELSNFPDLEGVVDVELMDCIDATLALVKQYPDNKVGMLNMASNYRPGGGVLTGATAQEEEICLRLTLYMFLAGQPNIFKSSVKYKLPDVSVVHTPGVFEIRDKNYQTLKPDMKTPKFDILSSAAIRKPELHKDGKFNKSDMELMISKIEHLLKVALAKNNTVLCLSAWGCGAFGNHPKWVAKLFIHVLFEKKYVAKFKHIRFAIIGNNNFEPFKKEFTNYIH